MAEDCQPLGQREMVVCWMRRRYEGRLRLSVRLREGRKLVERAGWETKGGFCGVEGRALWRGRREAEGAGRAGRGAALLGLVREWRRRTVWLEQSSS